jgi:alpha-mannosidase
LTKNLNENVRGENMYFIKERVNRIIEEIKKSYIYPQVKKVENFVVKEGNFNGGEAVGLDTADWKSFLGGTDRWGGKDKHYWFRTVIEIPKEYDGKTVVFELKTGREGGWDALNPQFIIYVNGKLIQGLDVNHREITITEKAAAEEKYHIALHSYTGMSGGLAELDSTISILDKETEDLYYNIKVPLEIASFLEENDKNRIDILNYLNNAVNILDLRKPFSENFYKSIKEANEYLEKEFYSEFCGKSEATAVCVGHTHIDVAWLWTLAQTREKTVRSFSTVLNLMKQYPEYIFMSSQPQLYSFLKEDFPEVYEELKQRVKQGRWEPEGAMWLEADCNLASGEALVRQVLFGTRFFEKEFGVKNRILWLPDVFGYSAALPQILKKSGIDYFMTTKISWNEYNKMPNDTFMWRGMDGTEILTHFITTSDYQGPNWLNPHATTYNGIINPNQVMGSWKRYQQKDINNEVLISFGYGDGGGGPTKEMLENARRMEKGIPGCPKVKIGKSQDYFKKLEKTVSNNKKLPKWVGELYLEYHRGTYTSMARNKKFNRKSEFLYQDTELMSVISEKTAGASYPAEELNKGWETILLNQFHDILPGSSIKQVYEDSKEQYINLIENGKKILNNALNNIAGKIDLQGTSVVVFNQLGFIRSDIVEFDIPEGFSGVEVFDSEWSSIPSQISNAGKVIFYAKDVPSKGHKVYYIKDKTVNSDTAGLISNIAANTVDNKYFTLTFDENFNVTSIYDKFNNREVLKKNEKANVLQAFEDKPHNFDAWDINIYYQEKMWEVNDVLSVELIEQGPVRTCIQVKRGFLDSAIVQNIYLYNDIQRIDFGNIIDWKEKHILLKAAFPVDIHSDKATYEIQYGNVERPTHWNTSWDFAKFEVCAHKWADLSEDGYGVSLLNDCKYGYDIKDSVMRLTLLKSATDPNEDADKEVHEFVYSIYPHSGGWKEAGTVQMAYSLNCPMYAKVEEPHSGSLNQEFSFVEINRENVFIEVVKKAEDSEDIIVRLYECYNRRTNADLKFFDKLSSVVECDMMENDLQTISFSGNSFEFEIKPYEIKTFKIKLN